MRLYNCTLALLLILVIPFTAVSQVSIDALPGVVAGDTLQRFIDLTPTGVAITAPGPDQEWNWQLGDTLRSSIMVESNDMPGTFPQASLKLSDADREWYYQTSPQAWEIVGLFGADPVGAGLNVSSFYTPKLPDIYAPVKDGDSSYYTTDRLHRYSEVGYSGFDLEPAPDHT